MNELATAELVDHAGKLLEGESVSAIPIGRVVRHDPGVNAPWSWHLSPDTFSFAFATVEVCDGIPSDVESGAITSDDYCPWSAKVVAVESASYRRSMRIDICSTSAALDRSFSTRREGDEST